MFHALLHKATWPQTLLIWNLPLVVLPVVQRKAMPNQPLLHVEPVTANLNLLHAELATVNQNLQHAVQVKVTTTLKPQHVVPHAGAGENKDYFVPGPE